LHITAVTLFLFLKKRDIKTHCFLFLCSCAVQKSSTTSFTEQQFLVAHYVMRSESEPVCATSTRVKATNGNVFLRAHCPYNRMLLQHLCEQRKGSYRIEKNDKMSDIINTTSVQLHKHMNNRNGPLMISFSITTPVICGRAESNVTFHLQAFVAATGELRIQSASPPQTTMPHCVNSTHMTPLQPHSVHRLQQSCSQCIEGVVRRHSNGTLRMEYNTCSFSTANFEKRHGSTFVTLPNEMLLAQCAQEAAEVNNHDDHESNECITTNVDHCIRRVLAAVGVACGVTSGAEEWEVWKLGSETVTRQRIDCCMSRTDVTIVDDAHVVSHPTLNNGVPDQRATRMTTLPQPCASLISFPARVFTTQSSLSSGGSAKPGHAVTFTTAPGDCGYVSTRRDLAAECCARDAVDTALELHSRVNDPQMALVRLLLREVAMHGAVRTTAATTIWSGIGAEFLKPLVKARQLPAGHSAVVAVAEPRFVFSVAGATP
jgi:hypothetical protein